DFVVNEGVLAFTTGYFNANPFPKNSLVITVNPSGTLRTTAAHALGGDNIDAGNSMGQIRILGGLVQFNGTQYLSNGLVSGEGRIVMEGGTLAGSADMRANGTSTFTILPSLNPSTISTTNGTNLQYGNVVMAVADGGAAKDLVVSSPLTSPAASTNTFTKSGAGLMEMGGANTYTGATNLNAGTILLSGTIRNSTAINVNGASQLLDVTSSNAFTTGHAAAEDAAHSINVTGGTLRFGPLSQCRLGNVNLTSSATMTVDRGTGNAANYDIYLGALSSAAEATVTVAGTSASTINGSGFLRLGTNTNFAVADANPAGADLTVSIGFRNQTLDQSNAAGGFTKTGLGSMELSGVSLHTGNTNIAEGTLNLATGGSLLFVPTTNGTSNKVTGAGSAVFAGAFSIDLAAANTTDGNSWILADVATQSFTSTFSVTSFADPENDGIWERELDGNLWSFEEATGTLSVAPAGNTYASWIDGFFPGETNPAIIGAGADPDADGIANAVEFVIGGNPENVMDAALLPTLELVTNPPALPAGQYLKFTYRRSAESVDAGVLSTAQHDGDLAGTWATALDNAGGVEIIETPNGSAPGIDKVEVFIPRGAATTLFGRLSVEVP
ncbi:MAG: autotransporter-associated beta strand repeat-containing protein, partial [Akkermansiaceae bacterium]|nr:autotransporter-associated beta strand repeat-containing protein [Akkermansiaceae bacterium]